MRSCRIGHLTDSTLVARQLDEQHLCVCGSPEYHEKRGVPEDPDALASHTCLAFRLPSTGRIRPWQFQASGRAIELIPDGGHAFNDGEALVAAAASGLGLVQVPDYMVREEIAAGRLAEVLKAARPRPLPISLVYPSARRIPPRLRVLIETLGAISPR